MLLNQALKEKIMDQRVRDRLIQEGKITKEEVDKFLKSLPDDSEQVKVSTVK